MSILEVGGENCPKCGSVEFSTTLMGIPNVTTKPIKDTNRAICHNCGYEAEAWEFGSYIPPMKKCKNCDILFGDRSLEKCKKCGGDLL